MEPVAEQLRAAGIDAWYDRYEIAPGEDFVTKLNAALANCDAAVIFFSHSVAQGNWVQAEINYLIDQHVNRRIRMIPVLVSRDAPIPPLLKTTDRLGIGDVQRLIDAILNRTSKPTLGTARRRPLLRSCRIALTGQAPNLRVSAWIDGTVLNNENQPTAFPAEFHFAFQDFLNPRLDNARDTDARQAAADRDRRLVQLGDAVGRLLLAER